MIDGLSESTRALLDAARAGLAPDAATVKRVHAKVTGAGLLAGVAAKLILLALVAGAAVAIVATRPSAPASIPSVAMPVTSEPSAPPLATVARVEAPPPPAPPARAVTAPVLVVVEHHADLAREVALIDAANTALRSDPHEALSTIQIYDVETGGHGQMAEDAAAIAIEARCRLADPSAAARLAAFDQQWPSSAQRTRLTEVCK